MTYSFFDPKEQENRRRIDIENAKVSQERAVQYGQDIGTSFQYLKDKRVEKFYGRISYLAGGYKHYSFTEVSCTPKVEELIKQGVK